MTNQRPPYVKHLKAGQQVSLRYRGGITVNGHLRSGVGGGLHLGDGDVFRIQVRYTNGNPATNLEEVISPPPPALPPGQKRCSPDREWIAIRNNDNGDGQCWRATDADGATTYLTDHDVKDWDILTAIGPNTLPNIGSAILRCGTYQWSSADGITLHFPTQRAFHEAIEDGLRDAGLTE